MGRWSGRREGSDVSGITGSSLPYTFDTTTPFRIVLTILGLIALVVLIGLGYSLAVGHVATAIQLSLVGAIVTGFGVVIRRNASGARGTVTHDAVVLLPATVLGVRLFGPVGRVPIERLHGVRVEHASGPVDPDVQGGPHDRVYLAGKPGTRDILIARLDRHDGVGGERFGVWIARELGLGYQVVSVAY